MLSGNMLASVSSAAVSITAVSIAAVSSVTASDAKVPVAAIQAGQSGISLALERRGFNYRGFKGKSLDCYSFDFCGF